MSAPSTAASASHLQPASNLPAAARRPRIRHEAASLALAFAALLFVFPSEVVLAGPLGSNGAPVRLVAVCALLLLSLDLLRIRRSRSSGASMPVVLLLVYLASVLFFFGWTSFRKDDPSGGALRELLAAVSACGIGMYTATRVTKIETAHRILGLLVGGCALSAAVGIVQALGGALVWSDVMKLPGMALAGGAPPLGMRNGMIRIFGTAGHPIEFAVVLGCCLPLAMHLGRHAVTAAGRRAAYAGAALMSLALPFALSRGGLLCIALSMLIYLSMQGWKTRATVGMAGLLAVTAAYVAVPSTYQAVEALFSQAADDPSVTGRLDDYPIVDAAFNAAPWLGGAPMPDIYLDNQWLVALTATGLIGTAFMAMLFIVPSLALVKAARSSRLSDPRRASLAAALAGGVVAIGFSGTVFDLFYFGQVTMLLFLSIGLGAVACRAPSESSEQRLDQP